MARPVAGARTAASEFFGGVATLFRGFAWWRRRPDLMLLGLVPAAIVFAGLVALLVVIIADAEGFVGWLTPFADTWDPALAQLFRDHLQQIFGFVVAVGLGVSRDPKGHHVQNLHRGKQIRQVFDDDFR